MAAVCLLGVPNGTITAFGCEPASVGLEIVEEGLLPLIALLEEEGAINSIKV